jgi:hypothetical protein
MKLQLRRQLKPREKEQEDPQAQQVQGQEPLALLQKNIAPVQKSLQDPLTEAGPLPLEEAGSPLEVVPDMNETSSLSMKEASLHSEATKPKHPSSSPPTAPEPIQPKEINEEVGLPSTAQKEQEHLALPPPTSLKLTQPKEQEKRPQLPPWR